MSLRHTYGTFGAEFKFKMNIYVLGDQNRKKHLFK